MKKSCRRIWLLERELLFWSFVGLAMQYVDNPKSVDADVWLDAIFLLREMSGGMPQVM